MLPPLSIARRLGTHGAAIFVFARRFRPVLAVGAAIITASCAAIFAFSRGASTDMPLTAALPSACLPGMGGKKQRKEMASCLLFRSAGDARQRAGGAIRAG